MLLLTITGNRNCRSVGAGFGPAASGRHLQCSLVPFGKRLQESAALLGPEPKTQKRGVCSLAEVYKRHPAPAPPPRLPLCVSAYLNIYRDSYYCINYLLIYNLKDLYCPLKISKTTFTYKRCQGLFIVKASPPHPRHSGMRNSPRDLFQSADMEDAVPPPRRSP